MNLVFDRYSDGQRLYFLDNIRAVAIILVVLGHSIIIYSSEWGIYTSSISVPELDCLKKVINLVQMPLFFSLSGFLFGFTTRKYALGSFVLQKVKRLLVPYLLVAALWMLPIKCAVGYKGYCFLDMPNIYLNDILLGNDMGHLWFLPCLFVCLILLYWLRFSFTPNRHSQLLLAGFFCLLSLLSGKTRFLNMQLISNICEYGIWVYLGFFIFLHYEDLRLFFHEHRPMVFVLLVLVALMVATQILVVRLLAIPCSILICILVYALMPNKENSVLSDISKYSFGIYLFHSPLVYITYTYLPEASPLIVLLINFVLFGLLSYFISYSVSNTKLCFLLGSF
jgi:peptidoglycan/LPS O-acetylase OafA/YrhL